MAPVPVVSFDQVEPRLGGWVLYQPDLDAPSPLKDDFETLPEAMRTRVVENMERAAERIAEGGWPALQQASATSPVRNDLAGDAPLFFLMVRGDHRSVVNAYVACVDSQPVLLAFSVMRAGPEVATAARNATKRFWSYMRNQRARTAAIEAAGTTVEAAPVNQAGTSASMLSSRSGGSATARRRASVRPTLPAAGKAARSTSRYELPAALERKVMELVGRRQQLAMRREHAALVEDAPSRAFAEELLDRQAARLRENLALEVGHEALSADVPPPALVGALGQLRQGDPDRPATWVRGGRDARTAIDVALAAADALCAHVMEGHSFDGPIFGRATDYAPGDVATYEARVANVRRLQVANAVDLVPGTGIDGPGAALLATGRAASKAARPDPLGSFGAL